MEKDSNLPVAYAVPVDSATVLSASAPSESLSFPANHSADCHYVELPVGPTDLGFQVQGAPLQVSYIHEDSPLYKDGYFYVGQYVHGVIMPNVEIIYLTDPNHLYELIRVNCQNPRTLIVSSSPFFVDTSVGTTSGTSNGKGVLFKHRLPIFSSNYLGMNMVGFPPVIISVAEDSPMWGRIHPGQTIEALCIPGNDPPIWNLASGGFTSDKVRAKLIETANMPGRLLVLKNSNVPYHNNNGKRRGQKGSDRAFDDCIIS